MAYKNNSVLMSATDTNPRSQKAHNAPSSRGFIHFSFLKFVIATCVNVCSVPIDLFYIAHLSETEKMFVHIFLPNSLKERDLLDQSI